MEELQALWRNASVSEEQPVSPQELDAMVNHRSSDELEKFRQVILGEYVFNWLALPLLIAGIYWQPKYSIVAIPAIALLGYMFYFYHRAFRQFKMIHYEDDMRTYLQRALIFVKTYVRHYKIICWPSGIIGFFAGYLLMAEDNNDSGVLAESSPLWELGFMLVGLVLVLLFCHFYIKHLYQARINNLEKLLSEFSEG